MDFLVRFSVLVYWWQTGNKQVKSSTLFRTDQELEIWNLEILNPKVRNFI